MNDKPQPPATKIASSSVIRSLVAGKGHSIWIEDGFWYTAPTVDPTKFGGHAYDNGGYAQGVRDCLCGASMHDSSSSGPVDPFGACPNNPLPPSSETVERPDNLYDGAILLLRSWVACIGNRPLDWQNVAAHLLVDTQALLRDESAREEAEFTAGESGEIKAMQDENNLGWTANLPAAVGLYWLRNLFYREPIYRIIEVVQIDKWWRGKYFDSGLYVLTFSGNVDWPEPLTQYVEGFRGLLFAGPLNPPSERSAQADSRPQLKQE